MRIHAQRVKPAMGKTFRERRKKGILSEKSVIYLIRIAREGFFWDYAPHTPAQQIDQLHITRSAGSVDSSQDETGPWLVIRMRLFSCGFFHLFCVDGGLPGRSAQSNPYLFFKKRVKSFGRKIKNHPARRSE